MSKPTGKEVALLAETLADGKRIPYVFGHETLTGADCQGFIEAVVRKLGGKMSYRGSNDMFRNACTMIVPLDEAKQFNLLQPGGALFILKHDDKELVHGYPAGLGNASHVGFYTGGKYFCVHSSSVQNDVVGADASYPWTHFGLFKEIAYDDTPLETPVDTKYLISIISRLDEILKDLKSYADIK